MPNTPLNPDALDKALEAGLETHDWDMFEAAVGDIPDAVATAIAEAVSAYLAVAQPVVNSFDPRELNRKGWTCGCEPGDYDECDDCLTAAHELANFLNRPEVKP